MNNFRTYNLAVSFYRQTKDLKLTGPLGDQLLRASSSIALNLAEGAAKRSRRDQRRFFEYSYASAKECKAIFELAEILKTQPALYQTLDVLCAHLYKLKLSTGA